MLAQHFHQDWRNSLTRSFWLFFKVPAGTVLLSCPLNNTTVNNNNNIQVLHSIFHL